MADMERFLGDPQDWPVFAVFELATWKQVEMKHCPQCGAAVLNPHLHKAWHLQKA